MGIRERVDRLTQQETQTWEKKKVEDEAKKMEMAQLYEKNLPKAIRTQKTLFEELQRIGVISMLQEMTGGPNTIKYPYGVKPTELKSIPFKATPEKFLRRMEKEKENPKSESEVEWHASIEEPKQSEDGSLDPSLFIQLLKEFDPRLPLDLHGKRERVDLSVTISYHPNRVLVIEGTEKVFKKIVKGVNDMDINRAELENAFTRAFHSPKAEPMEMPNVPYFGRRPRYMSA